MYLLGTLPPSKETIKGNIKTITEYKIDDDDGKKVKVNLDLSRCLCRFSKSNLRHCRSAPCALFTDPLCVPVDCAHFQDRNKESFQGRCKAKGPQFIYFLNYFLIKSLKIKIRLVALFFSELEEIWQL